MRPKGVWYRTFRRLAGGNNSVVECDLAKVEVAGSNPVSRSIFLPPMRPTASSGSAGQVAPPVGPGSSGAVAKW